MVFRDVLERPMSKAVASAQGTTFVVQSIADGLDVAPFGFRGISLGKSRIAVEESMNCISI